MAKVEIPVTQGVRMLRDKKIDFTPHLYDYVEHGGTTRAAEELNVPEHSVIKTLVFETDAKKPLVVLMHGDREVSTKQLARDIGARSVAPCTPQNVQKFTGYQVGGVSPFGLKTKMPIYVERTILEIDTIYINGGKRGFLVSISPIHLKSTLDATEVSVAIERAS